MDLFFEMTEEERDQCIALPDSFKYLFVLCDADMKKEILAMSTEEREQLKGVTPSLNKFIEAQPDANRQTLIQNLHYCPKSSNDIECFF